MRLKNNIIKMGQQNSRSPLVENAMELFNDFEQNKMGSIFKTLCHRNPSQIFIETDLREKTHNILPLSLIENLFMYMVEVIPPDEKRRMKGLPSMCVTEEDFLVSMAHMLKGSIDEKVQLVCCLATGSLSEDVMAVQIVKVLEQFMLAYQSCIEGSDTLKTWRLAKDDSTSATALAKHLGHELFYPSTIQQCDVTAMPNLQQTFTIEEVESWLGKCPIYLHMMDYVFHTLFPVASIEGDSARHSSLIPSCENVNWSKLQTVLNVPAIMLLNNSIPPHFRTKWRFLYSTSVHGASFTTFTGSVVNKGPCIIIIRDTGGYVFGGFLSQGVQQNGGFYGDANSFLFSLSPIMDIYLPSGYNNNFTYYNHGQETIPNGVGMGGQLGYCGLWIDSDFGKGHSKAAPKCTTYNSPQLSVSETFDVDYMEVWATGELPKVDEDEVSPRVPGSILDKDPEAKAMLAMLDRGPRSEGLREYDNQADIPEDHDVPHP